MVLNARLQNVLQFGLAELENYHSTVDFRFFHLCAQVA